VELASGDERFTAEDLYELSDLVARAWTAAADLDWSVPAAGLDWTCIHTADHAVDCVYAPAFFLASRKLDGYPEAGSDMTLGAAATPLTLVESLQMATRMLVAVVRDAPPEARASIFGRADIVAGPPDFLPRGALELILHGHDVCAGLGVAFEPPSGLCRRLREHTRPWLTWTAYWSDLPRTDDPWDDLLTGSGRTRQP
jgi:hypothetical protein